jgi:hypothetical protein
MQDLSELARWPWQSRRRIAAALLLSAVVVTIAALASLAEPQAASPDGASPLITGTVAPVAPAVADHELRIEFTRAGAEGLELAARLDEAGGLVTRPVRWTVRRALAGRAEAGEPVFTAEAPVADLNLQPGEYRVEANYGLAHLVHEVAIHPGQWVGITLILNVGGMRALSLVQDQDVPTTISAAHRVYALSGRYAGQRLTATGQGELVRLEAGDYRVESRFAPGNAVTETTVEIKPGVLSSLEIAHLAGLVRVAFSRSNGGERFEVRHLDSNWSWRGEAPGGDLVLAPGRYEARALTDNQSHTVSFEVASGQSIVVLLDP